jgi:phage terminase large subunit-like protein
VLDAVRERKPRFSPDDVVTEFALLMKSYGVKEAVADKWGGDFVVEAFKKVGITVKHAEMTKSDLYRELLPMLNAGRCNLIENTTLSKQLVSLERRVARGGKDSIDHPQGAHDDVANAAAGALVLCKSRQPMKISQAAMDLIGPGADYGEMARLNDYFAQNRI